MPERIVHEKLRALAAALPNNANRPAIETWRELLSELVTEAEQFAKSQNAEARIAVAEPMDVLRSYLKANIGDVHDWYAIDAIERLAGLIDSMVTHRAIEPKSTGIGQLTTTNKEPTTPRTTCDVVIVCALADELNAVKRVGGHTWIEMPSEHWDPTTYHTTTYVSDLGSHISVVAAMAVQMGLSISASLATKMILRFRPKLVVMVGIAAGAKRNGQNFGDIMAPNCTFDYGAGKIGTRNGKLTLHPDPHPIPINARLEGMLKTWSASRTGLDEICEAWQAGTPPGRLNLHVGPLGSGAAVINDRAPVADIKSHWRKLVGIEMEAYAVHCACRYTIAPESAFLCVKSICDFADKKNDKWQAYAAYTAAAFTHRFLKSNWEKFHL